MSTQYTDGTFSETLPYAEAIKHFDGAAEAGIAKAFYVGTPEQIDKVKAETSLADKVRDIENQLRDMTAASSKIIASPTPQEVEKFT